MIIVFHAISLMQVPVISFHHTNFSCTIILIVFEILNKLVLSIIFLNCFMFVKSFRIFYMN